MFSKSKVKKVDFVTLSKFYGKYKIPLPTIPAFALSPSITT